MKHKGLILAAVAAGAGFWLWHTGRLHLPRLGGAETQAGVKVVEPIPPYTVDGTEPDGTSDGLPDDGLGVVPQAGAIMPETVSRFAKRFVYSRPAAFNGVD